MKTKSEEKENDLPRGIWWDPRRSEEEVDRDLEYRNLQRKLKSNRSLSFKVDEGLTIYFRWLF